MFHIPKLLVSLCFLTLLAGCDAPDTNLTPTSGRWGNRGTQIAVADTDINIFDMAFMQTSRVMEAKGYLQAALSVEVPGTLLHFNEGQFKKVFGSINPDMAEAAIDVNKKKRLPECFRVEKLEPANPLQKKFLLSRSSYKKCVVQRGNKSLEIQSEQIVELNFVDSEGSQRLVNVEVTTLSRQVKVSLKRNWARIRSHEGRVSFDRAGDKFIVSGGQSGDYNLSMRDQSYAAKEALTPYYMSISGNFTVAEGSVTGFFTDRFQSLYIDVPSIERFVSGQNGNRRSFTVRKYYNNKVGFRNLSFTPESGDALRANNCFYANGEIFVSGTGKRRNLKAKMMQGQMIGAKDKKFAEKTVVFPLCQGRSSTQVLPFVDYSLMFLSEVK